MVEAGLAAVDLEYVGGGRAAVDRDGASLRVKVDETLLTPEFTEQGT